MTKYSIDNPLKTAVKLILRYNFVIFVVVVSIGLMASILLLSEVTNRPYSNGTSSTIFDITTINNVNKLQPSAKNTLYKTIPAGRASPFSE